MTTMYLIQPSYSYIINYIPSAFVIQLHYRLCAYTGNSCYAHLVLYTPDGTSLAYHMAINVDIDYIQSRFSTYITKDIDTRHSHLHLKHTPYSGIFTQCITFLTASTNIRSTRSPSKSLASTHVHLNNIFVYQLSHSTFKTHQLHSIPLLREVGMITLIKNV